MTAFGVNAIVLPPTYETGSHFHEEQEELYFVHSGTIEIEFGDGTSHELGPGGLAWVDAPTVRKIRNLSDSEDAVYVVVGGKDGYVGRDGKLPEGEDSRFGDDAPTEGRAAIGARAKPWRRPSPDNSMRPSRLARSPRLSCHDPPQSRPRVALLRSPKQQRLAGLERLALRRRRDPRGHGCPLRGLPSRDPGGVPATLADLSCLRTPGRSRASCRAAPCRPPRSGGPAPSSRMRARFSPPARFSAIHSWRTRPTGSRRGSASSPRGTPRRSTRLPRVMSPYSAVLEIE